MYEIYSIYMDGCIDNYINKCMKYMVFTWMDVLIITLISVWNIWYLHGCMYEIYGIYMDVCMKYTVFTWIDVWNILYLHG